MDGTPAYLKGRGRGRGKGAGDLQANKNKQAGAPAWNRNKAEDDKSAQDRFKEVSASHQQSIQRHLEDNCDESESSEEEDDIGNSVLESIFSGYSKNYSGGSVDVNKAQDDLLHSFRSGTSACLVCIDTIKREEPIWNCKGCACMFHIPCIQKWVREGVYQQVYQSQDDIGPTSALPWFCPKCRYEYQQSQCPNRYFCFCGKVQDPKFDPWLVPHSCGQKCGRQLRPDCGHACLLLCHPGPCPPCPQMVKSKCYCGHQQPQVRRCSGREWACGQPCGHRLSCGQHNCQQPCHPGECLPCPKTSVQSCLCGKKSSTRPCASPQWKCDQPCGKALRCGNHRCEDICHQGACGDCPRSGKRRCPCEKTEYELPCTEDIPTCGDTCGKTLGCGQHTCTQRCHQGECGSCRQVTSKRCRCGQKQKEVLCSKEYLCDLKCSVMRDCGKHYCKRKCCDGSCPTCEQVCGKTLRCRNHKCASRCHRGPCYPCPLTVSLSCFCKSTSITVPCGREKDMKPPKCNRKCQIPPNCHHPRRDKHRCHFNECPPCQQKCLLPLHQCDHTCPVKCHDAVKVKVEDQRPRAGPWDARPALVIQTVKKPCPPCQVPIPTECMGKHEVSNIPCAEVAPYSCARPCDRQLGCGNHTCSILCHIVTGSVDQHTSGKNCETCESPCEKGRPRGCKHPCRLPCHPQDCPPCTSMVRMRCHCNAVVKHIPCHDWTVTMKDKQDQLQSCQGQCTKSLPCGHQCASTCHNGACPNADQCKKKVTLRCSCRRKKKEVICHTVQRPDGGEKAVLDCDDVCEKTKEEKKKMKDSAEREKKEEEEKKQKLELEEYERKLKGRRKKRKHLEEVVELTFWEKNKTVMIIVSSLVTVFVAIFLFYWLSAS
ncbi:NF-X1-type zinc finger protein NFXL1-like [Haliotis cracherodii]|uniref:NF-X1-type zinc finger protein NFXL1-like n=1 Tax=Haliotis cracherodii TaxID=6455 RepID=UPI0039ED0F9E